MMVVLVSTQCGETTDSGLRLGRLTAVSAPGQIGAQAFPFFQSAGAAGPTNNSLASHEAAAGWMLLFGGRTLQGWQPTGQATWTAEEGVIRSRGQLSGYL